MEIKKLVSEDTQSVSQAQRQQTISAYQGGNAAKKQQVSDDDQVSISRMSRSLLQVSDIVREDDVERADRVERIKQRVSNGSYAVDSGDVAKSLIAFAAETSDVL